MTPFLSSIQPHGESGLTLYVHDIVVAKEHENKGFRKDFLRIELRIKKFLGSFGQRSKASSNFAKCFQYPNQHQKIIVQHDFFDKTYYLLYFLKYKFNTKK